MLAQMAQGQHLAAAPLLQQHRGTAAALDQGGEQASVAAEGRLLPAFSTQPQRYGGLAPQPPGKGAARQADQQGQAEAGWRSQSSNRELLSRDGLVSLGVLVRVGPVVWPGAGPGSVGLTGVNSASLTDAEAPGRLR